MKKCPDFFKTKRICLKAGVPMGTGFSSAEECVWKRLAACHRAEEREIYAHYCAAFYCLLFCCFFFFSLWYPSSLLLRNPFVISPELWLSWLHSPSPCAWTLLVPYTQSASLGATEMIKHTALRPRLSQQLPAHAGGDCGDRACRLWGGWQSRHQLCSSSSPPLHAQFDSIYKVTSRKTCQGQRSCHGNQEKGKKILKSHQGCLNSLLSSGKKECAALPHYWCMGCRNVAHSQVIFAQVSFLEDQKMDPDILW